MDPDASDEMIDHLVDFFDQIAPVYDIWANGQHGRVAVRLVELIKAKKGTHALDVGTGTGLVAHLVAAKVSPGSVIGIDLSDRMLSIARSKQAAWNRTRIRARRPVQPFLAVDQERRLSRCPILLD